MYEMIMYWSKEDESDGREIPEPQGRIMCV